MASAHSAQSRGLQLRQGKDSDVRIQRIFPNGPNDLQADDTLLTVNSKRVTTVQAAQDAFEACGTDEIILEVSRGDGRVQEVFSVSLPGKSAPKTASAPPAGPPEPKERKSKMVVEENDTPLAEQCGSGARGLEKEQTKASLPPPPQEAELEKELGNQAFKNGSWVEAIAHFTAAIDKCGPDLAPHTYFGNRSAAFLQNKEASKALDDAERAVQLDSSFGKGWYRKGMALLELGRAAHAVEALRRGKAVEPTSVQIVGALARAEREAKGGGAGGGLKSKPLEKEKETGGGKGEERKKAKGGAGGEEKGGDAKRGLEGLGSLWGEEEEEEGGGGRGLEGTKARAEEAKTKGNALFAKGQYLKAAEMFTEAMNLDEQNHVYPANRSAALLKESKAEMALEDAELSVRLCPAYAKGHFRKAQALAFLGRLDLGIDSLRRALDLDPHNDAVKAALDHFTRLRDGEDPEAIMESPATMGSQGAEVEVEVPKQAREGDNVTLQVNVPEYGAVKLQAKIPEGKKPGDKFTVKIGSMDELAETKKLEGIKAFKFGRMQKAADDFSDALHLRPRDPTLWLNRSAVLYALGRVEDALADADRATAQQPDMSKAHYRRGVALAGLGKYEEAIKALERAVSLDTEDELAAQQLQQAKEDLDRQRENKPTSREGRGEEDAEEALKREKFVTKRAEAEVREQLRQQWEHSQTKKKALAGKALERVEGMSNRQLSSEILAAQREDQHKQDTERAKFQAVAQRVEYDQFEQMVAGASLKPTKCV